MQRMRFSRAILSIRAVVTSVLMMVPAALSFPAARSLDRAKLARRTAISLPVRNFQSPPWFTMMPMRSASGSVLSRMSAPDWRAKGRLAPKDSTTSGLGMLKVTFSNAPLRLEVRGHRLTWNPSC